MNSLVQKLINRRFKSKIALFFKNFACLYGNKKNAPLHYDLLQNLSALKRQKKMFH